MKTHLHEIKVRELFEGYRDNQDAGVWAYGGKLNIRPPYQREFVYKDKQQKAVINSILNNFPLNVIYWVKKDDGNYELLDGQQRILSICRFLDNQFSIKEGKHNRSWHQLKGSEEGERILNYELYVYHCIGDAKDIVDWFEVINTAGEKLNNQEILNAVYSSPWLTEAKRRFSKRDCPAFQIGKNYLKGSAIRQDYLRTVLSWISKNNIIDYLTDKQRAEGDATELWEYFEKIVTWIEDVFKVKRGAMKGVNWGKLYAEYGQKYHNSEEIEKKLLAIIDNDDLDFTYKAYTYVFTGRKQDLQFRGFRKQDKINLYEKLGGKCSCGQEFKLDELEGDHIVSWSKGGETIITNLQLLCRPCNRKKSNK